MQAPYDRDRGQAPGGGDPSGWQGDQHGQPGPQGAQGYPEGYDPAAYHHQQQHPPQQPYGGGQPQAPGGYGSPYGQQQGGYPPAPQQQHQHQPHPQQQGYGQQPQQWAPGGSYQDQGGYGGTEGLTGQPGQQPRQAADDDAFAYLFRDQQQATPRQQNRPPAPPGPQPSPQPAPAEAAPAPPTPPAASAKRQGRAASLLKSSAVMAAGTLVSRITGFVRQLVTVAALGAAVLGDTYTVAWALPSMIYFLIIGGGLNSVFVPQLVRAMKNDPDGGDAYANRLLTVVMAALAALVIAGMLAAPLLVSLQSPSIADDPAANEVTVTFARYFLPTIFFTGVYTVIGQILNARDHFGPMMWTPVLNNIVVIFTFGMFLWVYGTQTTSGLTEDSISPEGVRLLGVGTLLGLVVQAGAMIPYLRAAGFRIRPRFDWRGHGLGKAATMAKWTVFFVLANQAALLVVTQLSTAAGQRAADAGFEGTGFIAYNSTLLIWQMPQAIITVSVMAALLPRLSRSAADGDTAAVRDDLSHGLRTSAVAIVPIAFAFVALGLPMCTLLFGSGGDESARSFGYILMAFGLGLIPYSAQYVVLRAFYAYEDTRTPFYNTVIVSIGWIVLSLISYAILPDRWVVAGIAFSYGIAYALGVGIAWRRLRLRLRTDLDGARIVRTYIRLSGASVPAALLGGAAGFALLRALGTGLIGSLAALTVGSAVLLAVFYLAARRMRVEELTGLVGMVRSRLGR